MPTQPCRTLPRSPARSESGLPFPEPGRVEMITHVATAASCDYHRCEGAAALPLQWGIVSWSAWRGCRTTPAGAVSNAGAGEAGDDFPTVLAFLFAWLFPAVTPRQENYARDENKKGTQKRAREVSKAVKRGHRCNKIEVWQRLIRILFVVA